jgi:hypothetical protein
MSLILAIDPGTFESGFVFFLDGKTALRSGTQRNEELIDVVGNTNANVLAIEMIASYGMPVGKEVFETCLWIGQFMRKWTDSHRRQPGDALRLIYRKDVKMHLCGSPRAKDPHIRQRLLDLIGPAGTKKQPGPTYGIKSHAWAALAVAVTAEQVAA